MVFEYHREFETPESSTQIWRYMDFVGFIWMLQHSALWFSRADHFEDKWEGAYPQPNVGSLQNPPSKPPVNWDGLKIMLSDMRRSIYLNCWHANAYESAAMWKIYATSGNSIAVRSTVGYLAESLSSDPRIIHIGKIKYIDYQRDSIESANLFVPYLRKRKSFEHESEVRLVLWSLASGNRDENLKYPEGAPAGYGVKVNLQRMVTEILVSPKANPWFSDLLKSVLEKYGYSQLPIRQSDFDLAPPM